VPSDAQIAIYAVTDKYLFWRSNTAITTGAIEQDRPASPPGHLIRAAAWSERHAGDMTLVVRRAPEEAKPVVHRPLELNAYEFSAIDGRDIVPDGEYGYPYLDHYWGAADDRAAFLFYVEDRLAGFALVRLGNPHQVAEFLVLPTYRRQGLGTEAARQVLSQFNREWVTHEVPGNEGAAALRRRAIPVRFTETSDAAGTTQRFVIMDRG
jgi:predicted acetyltransferase